VPRFEDAELRQARLAQGTVLYRELGSGPPVVLVHGLLVNGLLWARTAQLLASGFRVIVPDWPLGSHQRPMHPQADLTPAGLATIVADFLDTLDLDDVTLVGNDTGGALCQLLITTRPHRVGRLVLTPCDAYDNFLPALFRPLQLLGRAPGALWLIANALRLRPTRRLPIAYGWLSKRPLPAEATDAFLRPAQRDRRIRREIVAILRGINSSATRTAATRFSDFTRPVLLAWAPEDRFFPFRHAEAMAAAFPNARLERVDDSYTFVAVDQPERTAELIATFATQPGQRH